MANPKSDKEPNLKGTLYSVFGVGAVIIIVWAACFALFMERF